MSSEFSVVLSLLFLEKVNAHYEHGHFTETFLLCVCVCVASLFCTFILVLHTNKLICNSGG